MPTDYFALLARILLGSTMLYHGWLKLANLKNASRSLKKMGFNPAMFWTVIFSINEFLSGIFVIAGFYAELFAFLLGFEMLIISFWIILAKESFHHLSYNLQALLLSSAIIIFGSGAYALLPFDAKFFLWWPITLLIIIIAGLTAYLNQPAPRVRTETNSE